MSDHINETQVSKPGGKLAWVFGVIFLFVSLALFTASFISGLSILLAGILLLPPTRKWIEEKTGKHLDKKVLGGSIAALIIVMALAMPKNTTTNNEVAAQPAATNEAVHEPANTNTAPVVEEKKAEEAPVAPTPEPTPAPTPEPVAQAPAEPPMSDKLWTALDNSIKKREGYDIQWNEGEGSVLLKKNETSTFNESSLVRDVYTDIVKYGTEVFKIDGVKQVQVLYTYPFTDSYGKESTDPAVEIHFNKDEFQKYDWNNLKMSPVWHQMETGSAYYYIHPAVRKNLNQDKLYLVY